MISIYLRGRIWWTRGSIGGRQIRKSLDTQFQRIALQRAQELERLHDAGLDNRPHRWPEFESEFLHWIEPHVARSTWRKYKFVAGRFGESLQKQSIGNLFLITPSVVANYIAERMRDIHPKHKTQPGRGGLRSDLRILRRMFNYARDNKYILENPVKQPRLNYTSTQTLPFTDDELALMFADPEVQEKPNLHAIMLVLVYTGLRISDVAAMQRARVHLDTGHIELKALKNGAILSLPIHADVRPVLTAHLVTLNKAQLDSGFLFPTAAGRMDRSLEAKLRRVWKRCGIVNAHAHRFRDTFSVKLLAQGASLYDVARLLGNSMRVTERHYAPYVKELQDRGARLVNAMKVLPTDVMTRPTDPAPVTLPMPALKQ